ncbi:MAG TPA: sensor histidine kinase [Methylomusa anaerophila]|uniref:Oxygen sensor histidine kinase NreB n=1 Tax=Methylomusa anaerophila TaxID=1930071 RepID=A0A348AGY8_9FIRM|nr:sensor histidine kinase [Methylomusa anaerophila]BBB90336.1 signal transduction histidine-protein kinase/phosphatase DegS [Methylomusa anaerophila]HML89318.1 sensor histidine kinase [Methylomusa anaerophila]
MGEGRAKNLDINVLDKIVKHTIGVVEKSKSQIFDIYEAARGEMENVKRDVERIKKETTDIISRVDALGKRERRSRLRLMEVSRNFHEYNEVDIKAAYEDTSNVQLELAMAKLQEQTLRHQRDDLEIRLKVLKQTVEKAENLVSQVGAVLGYLGNQMGSVVTEIESLKASQIFGANIIRAQEEERRRVAREIHDGPAQAMANIVFRAEVCEKLIDADIARAKDELKDLRGQVRIALQETRKIIFDLRPMTLDDLGLIPTIRKVLDMIKERSGIFPELIVMGEDKRLDSHIEIGLFRIIQEALHNVEKHSKAGTVRVRIEFVRSNVIAIVEDDGQGFDNSENIGGESFGLMGMRERINLLQGEISIQSKNGSGTKITVNVPI